MTTDQARTTLAKWLRDDQHGNATAPNLVVRLTSGGFLCDTPQGFTIDEAAALAVWVRAATK